MMNILFYIGLAFNFLLVACKTYTGEFSLSLANGITAILIPLATFITLAVIFKNQGTATVGGIIACIITFISALILL